MTTAVGIDVGKAMLDLAVDGVRGVIRFANTQVGIGKLVARLAKLEAPRIVVEATGGYEEAVPEACCDAGLWIYRVNPRQARDFAVPPASWPRPMPSMPLYWRSWHDSSTTACVAMKQVARVSPAAAPGQL